MKDFFGQELAVGDYVAFEEPKYRNLILGVIVGFTPKQVRLLWNSSNLGGIEKLSAPDGTVWNRTFITMSGCVIKRPNL